MPFINKAGCECLNESDEHGFDNCLREKTLDLPGIWLWWTGNWRSGLVEIVSVCVRHVSISWSPVSLPRWSLFLPFYNFTSVLWPCQLTPFLCLFMPAALQRITELLDCPETWVEAFTILKSFCSFLSCLPIFCPPEWDLIGGALLLCLVLTPSVSRLCFPVFPAVSWQRKRVV